MADVISKTTGFGVDFCPYIENGNLHFTRVGARYLDKRILFHEDTGEEITSKLSEVACKCPNITILEKLHGADSW